MEERVLFTEISKPNKEDAIEVSLFCDEIKNKRCSETGRNWHYIGLLAIPTSTEEALLKDIHLRRFRAEKEEEIDENNSYYSKNNRVVHFSDLNAEKYHISKRWLEYILDKKSVDRIHFSILGINESALDRSKFDKQDLFNSLYNRFFRTAIAFSLLKFFGRYRQISVKAIYHEQGDQKHHLYFPWHSIYSIGKEYDKIDFQFQEIFWLEKDHSKSKYGNLIQLTDVFFGGVCQLSA